MPEVTGRLRTPRLAAPPTAPTVGEMYYDTGSNQLLYWNNTAWTQAGGSGGLGAIYDSDQIGIVKQWAGTTIPTNWLLCDGRSLARSAYPDLFTALGGASSPWGLPDASTFNIPDLRSRMLIGAGAGVGLTARTIATTGGEEFHTLSNGEMPVHSHTGATTGGTSGYADTNHYHGVNIQSGTVSSDHSHTTTVGNLAGGSASLLLYGNTMISGHPGAYTSPGQGSTNWGSGGISANHSHNVAGNTAWQSDSYNNSNHAHSIPALGIYNDGGGGAHNTMPPWTAITMIIKAIGTRLDSGLALRGTDGLRGTQWFTYTGTGVPAPGAISAAVDGDMAVRQSDSEVFQRVAGVWVDQQYALGYAMQTAMRAYRNAAFTTGVGWNKIPLDTVSYDPSGNFQLANGRYICPVNGFYQVNASSASNAAASEGLITSIYKNGLEIARGSRTLTGAAGLYNLSASDILQCNAGDYIEMWVYDSIGSHTLEIQSGDNYMSVVRVDVSGRPGTSMRQYTGSGTPTITGINGDLAMRTSDGEIFQMVAGAWTDQNYSLVGSNLNATYTARAYRSAALTVTGSTWQKIPLDVKSFDPGNNFSTANGRYVCPVSGYYQVEAAASSIGTNGVIQPVIQKNGVTVSGSASTSVGSGTYPGAVQTDVIQCVAGDYLELWVWTTQTGINNGPGSTYLAVTLIAATAVQQHPLQPASQARAYRAAALNLGSAWTKMPLDTISYDSGNNFQLANGRYICPVAGFYHVDYEVTVSVGSGTDQGLYPGVYKNGVLATAGSLGSRAGTMTSAAASGSDVIQCNAGDYLELWYYNQTGSPAASVGPTANYLSVSLVGTMPTAAPAHAARLRCVQALTPAASTWTKIPVNLADFDPGGNGQLANGRYLCPVTGVYDVMTNVMFNVSGTGTYSAIAVAIYKNGSVYSQNYQLAAMQTNYGMEHSDKVQCNAGDYLEVWCYNTQGTSILVSGGYNSISVSLLTGTSQQGPQGPQGIPGNSVDAKTAARVFQSAAQALPSATATKIAFANVSFDSGNNFNVTNGRYVCPATGFYQVDSLVGIAGAFALSTYIYKNGVGVASTSVVSDGTHWPSCLLTDVIQCSAGDYIELYCYPYGAVNTLPAASQTYLSIVKADVGGPPGPAGGAANMVQQIYAMTGYTPDRTMNPSTTSLGEVAAVLATLIDDMKAAGLLHA